MSRSEKQPKRIKQWINEYGWGVAVPLIELRRGEVVVDVEALVKAFDKEYMHSLRDPADDLRAAIKKVGVR